MKFFSFSLFLRWIYLYFSFSFPDSSSRLTWKKKCEDMWLASFDKFMTLNSFCKLFLAIGLFHCDGFENKPPSCDRIQLTFRQRFVANNVSNLPSIVCFCGSNSYFNILSSTKRVVQPNFLFFSINWIHFIHNNLFFLILSPIGFFSLTATSTPKRLWWYLDAIGATR